AYLEHFPRGMVQFQPDANLARQRQVFQVWIRPVEPENGHFALRIALFELKKLIENGLSQEDFENTRSFLDKYASLMATRQSAQLGYSLDGEYYGTGEFVPWVRGQLASLTRDMVNQAIRSHLSWENVAIVAVTKDAEALRDAIVGNKPSPIAYNAPKPPDVLEEDKRIERFALKIGPESARVVDIEKVFED
ncbi:MAG TPA: insulinase family protein, partial [Candidatus Polarisedimenticolia bacterium]|nr:insulinase family protein [Candidatus Polarisedimenticolia bacterium]